MAWYDPAAPGDPNASYLGQNPAIRDAMMAFGAQLLTNARKPGMAGVGEGLQAGFNTWAQRRDVYAKEAQRKQLEEMLKGGGGVPSIGQLSTARAPSGYGFAAASGAPDLSGAGAANLTAPSAAPNLGAPDLSASPYLGSPRYPGAFAGQQAPGGAIPLPHPISTPTPPLPAGQDPTNPASMYWNPASAYDPHRNPPLPAGYGAGAVTSRAAGTPRFTSPVAPAYPFGGTDVTQPAPYVPPLNEWSSAAPGLFNLAGGGVPGAPFGGGTGADVQFGGADRDVLASPVDAAVDRAGLGQYAGIFRNNMIQAESGGRHRDAKGNITTSPAGAKGLAQLMPGTFAEMKRKYGIEGDITDEAANAEAGARYFKEQLDRYDGDVSKAVAAYNAGPGNIDKGIYPAETRNYLATVLGKGGTQVADVSGGQGRATMAGGAEGDIPQPPSYTFQPRAVAPVRADLGGAGISPQPSGGQAEDDTGGIWNTRGDLTEDAKRTLRLSLMAGGPEGVQQALIQMASQKPEAFGSAETGYYLRYPNGKIKQLLAPKTVKQSRILKPAEAQEMVGPAFDPRNVYELDEKNDLTINKPGSEGVTVNLGEKADQGWFTAGVKQSTDWTAGGRKQANSVAQMAPVTEILKDAVLRGEEVSGFGSSATLSLRRAAQSMGLPFGENVQIQEMIDGLRQGLMTDLHEPGMGSSSDWESQAMVAAGPSLDKSTEGNYILVKGLEAQANRKLWLGRQSEKYMDAIDPATGQKRNHLKGFDEWLNTPGADGHAPIEQQPHLMTNTSGMSADEVQKNTKPGDILFVDGQVKVRPKEILDDRTMTPEQAQNLKPHSLVILDGQLRIVP